MNGRELRALRPNEGVRGWKTPRRTFGLLLCSAFLFASAGCIPYRKGNFRGPATVSDTGVFSYYRYHFRFSPPMALEKAGKQTYSFRALPKDPMTVWFGMDPFDFHEYKR